MTEQANKNKLLLLDSRVVNFNITKKLVNKDVEVFVVDYEREPNLVDSLEKFVKDKHYKCVVYLSNYHHPYHHSFTKNVNYDLRNGQHQIELGKLWKVIPSSLVYYLNYSEDLKMQRPHSLWLEVFKRIGKFSGKNFLLMNRFSVIQRDFLEKEFFKLGARKYLTGAVKGSREMTKGNKYS